MTQQKTVLFLQHQALRDDFWLRFIFESKGYRVRTYDLSSEIETVPTLSEFSKVYLSGAFGNTLSSSLSLKKLSLVFKKRFSEQKPATLKETKFYAFGMGALALIESELWPFDRSPSDLSFLGVNSPSAWIQVKVEAFDSKKINSLILTQRPLSPHSLFVENLKPWIQLSQEACGWEFENLFFSYVDFLAVKDSAILPSYGYFDSSFISTASEILDKLTL